MKTRFNLTPKEKLVLRILAQVEGPIQETALLNEIHRKRGRISKGGLAKILHSKRVEPMLKIKKLSRKNVQIDFNRRNEDAVRFLLEHQTPGPSRELIRQAEADVNWSIDRLPKVAESDRPRFIQLSAEVILFKYCERLLEEVYHEADSITGKTATQVGELFSRRASAIRLKYRDGLRKLLNENLHAATNGWSEALQSLKGELVKPLPELKALAPTEITPPSTIKIIPPVNDEQLKLTDEQRALLNDAMRRDRFLPRLRENRRKHLVREMAEDVKKGGIVMMEEMLKSNPFLLNARLEDGNTALHLATETGDIATVKYLLGKGALTDRKNQKGKTPLEIARKLRHKKVERLLLNHKAFGNA